MHFANTSIVARALGNKIRTPLPWQGGHYFFGGRAGGGSGSLARVIIPPPAPFSVLSSRAVFYRDAEPRNGRVPSPRQPKPPNVIFFGEIQSQSGEWL